MGKMWRDYGEPDDISLLRRAATRGATTTSTTPATTTVVGPAHDDLPARRASTCSASSRHELEVGFDHQCPVGAVRDHRGPVDLRRERPGRLARPVDRAPVGGRTSTCATASSTRASPRNIGIRADYWFLGREAEAAHRRHRPTRTSTPETREEFYEETHSFFGRRYKLKLSPRVIVAHPITENSSFFFNYGEFTQIPSYRYVYSKLTSISSESFPLLGNPNLNPQVSVNYEVGAKHQFLPTAAANVTFFVKDIYDYPTATLFSGTRGRGEPGARAVLRLPERPLRPLARASRSSSRSGAATTGRASSSTPTSRPRGRAATRTSRRSSRRAAATPPRRGSPRPSCTGTGRTSSTANFDLRFDDSGAAGPGCSTPGSTSTCRAAPAAPTRPRTRSPTRPASPTRRTGRSRSPPTCG